MCGGRGKTAKGSTRSMLRAPQEALKGLARGGSGRVEGVYGREMAVSVELGECEREGVEMAIAEVEEI